MKTIIHCAMKALLLSFLVVFPSVFSTIAAAATAITGSVYYLYPRCGDGNKSSIEICDGADNSISCRSLLLGAGNTTCDSDCHGIGVSSCQYSPVAGNCGDGVINYSKSRYTFGTKLELCDGRNRGGFSCTDFGFDGGTLYCDNDCLGFNTKYCKNDVCGDNIVGPTEICDGTNLNNKSCSDFGFTFGTLECKGCDYDTSKCSNFLWVINFTPLLFYQFTPLVINPSILLTTQLSLAQPTLSGLTSIYDTTFRQQDTIDTSSFNIELSAVLKPTVKTVNLPDAAANELYPVFEGALSRLAESAKTPANMEIMRLPNVGGNVLVAAVTDAANTTLQTSLILPLQLIPYLTGIDFYTITGDSGTPYIIMPMNPSIISAVYFSTFNNQSYTILDISSSSPAMAQTLSTSLQVHTRVENGVLVHAATVADKTTPLLVLSKNCTDCHSGGFVPKLNWDLINVSDPVITQPTIFPLATTNETNIQAALRTPLSLPETVSRYPASAGAAPALLSGTVSNSTDNPISGAWVLLHGLAADPVLVAMSQPNPPGEYIAMVPAGNYTVSAEHPSYLTTTVPNVNMPSGDSVVQNYTLMLNAAVDSTKQPQQSMMATASDAASKSAEPMALGVDKSQDNSPPTAPGLTTAVPMQGSATGQTTVSLTLSPSTDGHAVAGYSVLLDSSSATSPAETISTTSLPSSIVIGSTETSYYLHIKAKDTYGNWNATTTFGPWYYDITPPSSPTITSTTSPAADITHSGSRDAYTSIWLQGSEIVSSAATTSWSYNFSGLQEGINSYSLTAKDSAGNESTVTNINIIRDSAMPTVSLGGYTSTTVDLQFSENDMQNSLTGGNYLLNPALALATGTPVSSLGGNRVRLELSTAMTPFTIYTLTISSVLDAAGNALISGTIKINDTDSNGIADDLEASWASDDDGDGYSENDGDCNDADINIHPGAIERCDTINNDCNATTVDGAGEVWFNTPTDCGTGECAASGAWQCQSGTQTNTCVPGTPAAEICGNGLDEDCDGSDLSCNDVDNDGDGYTENQGDCNDSDGTVNPGATELCDGIDNDCDSLTADGFSETWLGNSTSCGVGVCSASGSWQCLGGSKTDTCSPGTISVEICGNSLDEDCDGSVLSCNDVDNDLDGYTENQGDCNDFDGTVHPGAVELCDGIDNDCNGTTADGTGELWFNSSSSCGIGMCLSSGSWQCVSRVKTNICTPGTPVSEQCGNDLDEDCNGSDLGCGTVDGDSDGFTPTGGDCNDADTNIHPGAVESCDNIDNDCNGTSVDGAGETWYDTKTSCGVGLCFSHGFLRCQSGGQVDTCVPGAPGVEICGNSIDDDCDGIFLSCDDVDNDGDHFTENQGDCDDTKAAIYPGAPELCDGIDNDCNATTIDGSGETWFNGVTECGVGSCLAAGAWQCQSGMKIDNCLAGTPGTEICGNDIDEDCNGADLSCLDVDNDGDHYTENQGDCDDAKANIHPGALEKCDNIDNDCNGTTTDGSGEDWYNTQSSCGAGICSDTGLWRCQGGAKTDSCLPGVAGVEICGNGIDEDCNGVDLSCSEVDNDADGYTGNQGDCNDSDAAINPGAPEICDNIDNDCNATTPDGSGEDWFGNAINCGVGACSASGSWQCQAGSKTNTCLAGTAATEICGNGIDEDCNGLDLSCNNADNDNDGFSLSQGDCNDDNSTIYPGALELCDATDNDCNSNTPDGSSELWYGRATTCGVGACASRGYLTCAANKQTDSCQPGMPLIEICGNGIDEDCDGSDIACNAMDNDGDGYSELQGDCNDNKASVSPAAPLPGDVTGDGYIEIEDAMLALGNAAGTNSVLLCSFADVNGDGRIGLAEAIYILRKKGLL